MVDSYRRARPLAVATSVFLAVFVLGVSAPTYADPGNNGKGAEMSSASAHSESSGQGQGLAKGRADVKATGSSQTKATSKATTKKGGGSTTDLTSPQPLSNADKNSGGANGQCPGGPYCSTRDGSPSLNGNGNGKAVGKPCAGCVGKADNKNPKGQMPNGSDHNAGYECDRNHGIGRSNPAHTGCKVTPPKPPKPPVPPKPPKPPVPPTPPKPPKPPVPHVKPPHVKPPAEVPAVVAQVPRPAAQLAPAAVAPAAVAQAPAVLPPTGADPLDAALAAGGGVVLLAGVYLLLRRRTS
jgi:hypothetical protein